MPGPFVHQIDPIIAELGGVYLWWYGLSYTLGFLGVHLWFRRARNRLGMTLSEVYSISIYLAVGVLIGGRLIEVAFYEWGYYSNHLLYIPAYWLGGMATHGLLLGGTLGTFVFTRRFQRSFLEIADELVIVVAWIMGVGRIGNFIDGQISGSVTDVWWAVQFPDLEGFRHPVVLYDGLKNLLLIPLLLWISSMKPPRGVVFAQFIFWYAFLRIITDLFREYRVEAFGIGTGQIINICMASIGLLLTIWFYWRKRPGEIAAVSHEVKSPDAGIAGRLWLQRILFSFLLIFSLSIPSDWTQDIPARYAGRHAGLKYSMLYPRVDERAPVRESRRENGIAEDSILQ